MIVASRTGKNVSYPFIKKIPKYFIIKLANYITNYDIPDIAFSVLRTGEHGSLDPLWAPLADPKIDRKSFMLIYTCIFVQKKCVPKQVHKQDHFLSKFCVILVTPQPCFLSARLHGSTILQKWPDH